jgi:hypothetical protein
VVLGDVHFFALDSDEHEPTATRATSTQARWLQQGLAASKSPFNIVAMHHPPYSSGPTAVRRHAVALRRMGRRSVLAGHDHCYERLNIDGVTYIVSGLGGVSIYSFAEAVTGSVARYNDQYGATILEASADEMRISFFDIDGHLIDRSYSGHARAAERPSCRSHLRLVVARHRASEQIDQGAGLNHDATLAAVHAADGPVREAQSRRISSRCRCPCGVRPVPRAGGGVAGGRLA